MQHEYVLKKLNFDLLSHPYGSGGGGIRAKYHVAAFEILINLICTVTIF